MVTGILKIVNAASNARTKMELTFSYVHTMYVCRGTELRTKAVNTPCTNTRRKHYAARLTPR